MLSISCIATDPTCGSYGTLSLTAADPPHLCAAVPTDGPEDCSGRSGSTCSMESSLGSKRTCAGGESAISCWSRRSCRMEQDGEQQPAWC